MIVLKGVAKKDRDGNGKGGKGYKDKWNGTYSGNFNYYHISSSFDHLIIIDDNI